MSFIAPSAGLLAAFLAYVMLTVGVRHVRARHWRDAAYGLIFGAICAGVVVGMAARLVSCQEKAPPVGAGLSLGDANKGALDGRGSLAGS